jgi:L-serine dehydratase
MAKDYSVFDIVGPNMIGPSSSHTAGAARLGKVAATIAIKSVKKVKFLLHGSFAETYRGHGTDKALVGGILGFAPDDAQIRNSFDIALERGVKFEFLKVDLGADEHPNAVKILMELEDGSNMEIKGASIGGGNIKLTEVEGLPLDFNGSKPTLIIAVKDIAAGEAYITKVLGKWHKTDILSMSAHTLSDGKGMFVKIETEEKVGQEVIDELSAKEEVVQKIMVLDKF